MAIAAYDSLTLVRSARVGEARLLEGRALLELGDTVGARRAVSEALRAVQAGAGVHHPRAREATALAQSLPGPPFPN